MFSLIAAFGCFVALGGVAGWFSAPGRTPRRQVRWAAGTRRAVTCVAAGAAAWLVTQWPAAGVLAGAGMWWLPGVIAAQTVRRERIARTEAVATWTEQLRDVVAASGGIGEALAATAVVAPAPIRPETTEFARRLRRESSDEALAWLGRALDDPTSDQVVVALRLALGERGERISEVLSAIAAAARADARQATVIESTRAKLWRQVTIIVSVIAATFGLLVLFQRDYLEPYSTPAGQVVLLIVGGVWAFSLRTMVRLASFAEPPRVLAHYRTDGSRRTAGVS